MRQFSALQFPRVLPGRQTITSDTTCKAPDVLGTTRCQTTTTAPYVPPPPPPGPNLHDRIMQQQQQNAQAFGNAGGSLAAALIIRHKINSIKKEQCKANGVGSQWLAHNLLTGQIVAGGTCSEKDAK